MTTLYVVDADGVMGEVSFWGVAFVAPSRDVLTSLCR